MKLVNLYLTIFLFFSVVFIASFHTPLFSNQTIFFYRGIILFCVTLVITILFAYLVKKKLKIGWESMIASLAITTAFHLSFFILFPVTFERSITMYLLNSLNNQANYNLCGGYSSKELEKKLIDEYIIKNKALQKRVKEQSEIDLIRQENSCFYLTKKGKAFVGFAEKIKALYGIR